MLVEIAKMLGFFCNGLPAFVDLIIGAAFRVLLSASLFFQIIQVASSELLSSVMRCNALPLI